MKQKSLRTLLCGYVFFAATLPVHAFPHIHISPPHISPPHISIPAPNVVVNVVKANIDHIASEAAKTSDSGVKAVEVGVQVAVQAPKNTVQEIASTANTLKNAGVQAQQAAANLAAHDAGKVTKQGVAAVHTATAAVVSTSQTLAERTGDLANTAKNDADHVEAETIKTLTTVANNTSRNAAHFAMDAAHTTLLLGLVEKKQVVANVHETMASAAATIADVEDGQIEHAANELVVTVTSAGTVLSPVAQTQDQARASFAEAVEMDHAALEACQQVREGRYGSAAEAMGRSLTDAGELVSQADPEAGAVLIQSGTAIAQDAPYAEQTVLDIKAGKVQAAVEVEVGAYTDPVKSAVANAKTSLQDAKAGHFDQATLEAAAAVILSQPDQQNVNEAKKSIITAEAALDQARAAISLGKQGDLGSAAESLGDALSSAGSAMQPVDKDDGNQLADLGKQIHEAAAHGKEATEAEKQTVAEVKQVAANPNGH